MGTSPASTSVVLLLCTLCEQIWCSYHEREEWAGSKKLQELAQLCSHFRSLLSCATRERPLVIILDSLDQLSSADGAYSLAWLPVTLPAHVKLIVSVVPDEHSILENLQIRIEDPENFLKIQQLGASLAVEILNMWLHLQHRTITKDQMSRVMKAFQAWSMPLFVKLVFDVVKKWPSYAKPYDCVLQTSTRDTIMALFDRVELQHGKVLLVLF